MTQTLQKINYLAIVAVVAILFLYVADSSAARSNKDFEHSTTGFILTGPHVRLECDACHLRGMFKGIPRECVNCHDRGSPIGSTQKPLNHVPTTGDCESCHASSTWQVSHFDHNGVMGRCVQCHNNINRQGKHAGHFQSSDTCDDCHITATWRAARVDHSNISGACFSCHNGVTATGKNQSHVASTNICDSCHSTSAWIPAGFNHDNVDKNGSCISCHASKYKISEHPKTENPSKVYYTATELQNCASSTCHIYTDNTYTVIKKSRPGGSEHSVRKW